MNTMRRILLGGIFAVLSAMIGTNGWAQTPNPNQLLSQTRGKLGERLGQMRKKRKKSAKPAAKRCIPRAQGRKGSGPYTQRIGPINTYQFPTVQIPFEVMDNQGNPWAHGIRTGDLALYEREQGTKTWKKATILQLKSLSAQGRVQTRQVRKAPAAQKQQTNLLLLIDTSCSMGYTRPTPPYQYKGYGRTCKGRLMRPNAVSRFDRAIQAARGISAQLWSAAPNTRIGVYFFNTVTARNKPVFFTRQQKAQMLKKFDSEGPCAKADTPLYFAVQQSVDHMRRAFPRDNNIIMLLSDGLDDTKSNLDMQLGLGQLLKMIQPGGDKSTVRICAVKLKIWGSSGGNQAERQSISVLQSLASNTNGLLVPAENYNALKRLFVRVTVGSSFLLVGKSNQFFKRSDLLRGLEYKIVYKGKSPLSSTVCACTSHSQCQHNEFCRKRQCQLLAPYLPVSTTPLLGLGKLFVGVLVLLLLAWFSAIRNPKDQAGQGGSGKSPPSGGGSSSNSAGLIIDPESMK